MWILIKYLIFWPHLWELVLLHTVPLNLLCVQFFLVFAVFCLLVSCESATSLNCAVWDSQTCQSFSSLLKSSLSLCLCGSRSPTHFFLLFCHSLSTNMVKTFFSALTCDSSSNEHTVGSRLCCLMLCSSETPWKQQRHVYVLFTATNDSYYLRLHNSWFLFMNIVHTIWISWIIIQYKLWNNES